ncbi:MAG TPA: hypothetical protein VJ806_00910 [Luteimonas sp.]|nr:hypothetical protein [Luteimonas sp.]
MASRNWCLIPLLMCAAIPAYAEEGPIPIAEARAVFAQAQSLCKADGGRLWGASLCAPIMLVDPKTRAIVASRADAKGALRAQGGVFVGELPPEANAANTAVEWSGTRWTQMLWPLPKDDGTRSTLIAHELFHRLQPSLPIASAKGGDNPHLDSLEGRYTLQLEWRALAKALQAGDRAAKRAAAADALTFRAERYRRFPEARADEAALETNEGLAEYTGVMAGNATAQAQLQTALDDLQSHVDDPSFVRSFAYATGPAYGMLLDDFAPGWRKRLAGMQIDLGTRLRDAARIEVAAGDSALAAAAARYDGAALRVSETAREQKRLEQLARNRARFVEGPVLKLDLIHMSVQFNPSNLQPLDGVGTVYPTMRVTDDWGTLEVEGGAVMRSDWKAVIVAAPESAGSAQGPGWKLTLKPGWTLAPDARAGDFVLKGPGS